MTPRANSNLYADEGPLAEADMSGNITTTYGWSPNGIWGTAPQWKADVTMGSTGTNPATLTYHYFHNDHLGSSQRLTNDQGVLAWSARMEAFGKTTTIDSIITNLVNGQSQTALMPTMTVNNFRFAGQIEDGETGLKQNWHRDYDSNIGRYIESDPLGLSAGTNTYHYAGSNPLSLVDMKGLFATCVIDGNNINLSIPITPGGPASSQALIDTFTTATQDSWTGRTTDGFQMNVRITSGTQNTVNFQLDSGRANVRNGNAATIYSNSTSWVMAHESGHLLGLDDRYRDQNVNGATVSVPLNGFAGSMMGDYGGTVTPAERSAVMNRWCGMTSGGG